MGGGDFFAKFEFDAAVGDGDDAPATDDRAGSDVEFLAYAGAQDADQVVGVRAGEGGVGAEIHRRSIGGGS